MRIRRQDWCVLVLHALGLSTIRNFVRQLKARPGARFIAFHDVPDEASSAFESKLRFLKEKTNVVSMNDYFTGQLSSKRLNVVITFDDGYKSWNTIVAPLLKGLAMPATFFISSGFVGLSRDEEAKFVRFRLATDRSVTGGLSEKNVRELAEQGFTIGGHTYDHVNLCELRDESEIAHQISSDKERLEAILGRPLEYFAYPFGACNHPCIDLAGIVRQSGYKGAVTTLPGFNAAKAEAYSLKRELTDARMPLAVFKARVYGNYDPLMYIKRAPWRQRTRKSLVSPCHCQTVVKS